MVTEYKSPYATNKDDSCTIKLFITSSTSNFMIKAAEAAVIARQLNDTMKTNHA